MTPRAAHLSAPARRFASLRSLAVARLLRGSSGLSSPPRRWITLAVVSGALAHGLSHRSRSETRSARAAAMTTELALASRLTTALVAAATSSASTARVVALFEAAPGEPAGDPGKNLEWGPCAQVVARRTDQRWIRCRMSSLASRAAAKQRSYVDVNPRTHLSLSPRRCCLCRHSATKLRRRAEMRDTHVR